MSIVITRRAIRGLGNFSPEMLRLAMERPVAAMSAALVQGGVDGGGASAECMCKAQALMDAMGSSDPLLTQQVAVACTANPALMDDAARGAGVDLDACKPWYKRKLTWIAGGLAAAAVGAFVVVRSK